MSRLVDRIRWDWPYSYALAVLIGLAIAIPLAARSSYAQQLLFLTCSGAIAALCTYLIIGLSGQFALITNALIGVGAYAAALSVMELGLSYWQATLFAGLLAGALGLLIGAIALRVRGHYLALASVGFSIVVVQVLTNWRSLTRGSSALTGIPKPGDMLGWELSTRNGLTALTLAVLVLFALVVLLIEKSRIGTAAKILREDEGLAEAVGIDTLRVKLTIFTSSGVVLGGMGAIHAAYLGLLQPDMFSIFGTVDHLIMVIVGGFSVLGAIVGAVIVILVPEGLRALGSGRELVLGFVLLAVVIGAPQGIVGTALDRARIIARPRDAVPVPTSTDSQVDNGRGGDGSR